MSKLTPEQSFDRAIQIALDRSPAARQLQASKPISNDAAKIQLLRVALSDRNACFAIEECSLLAAALKTRGIHMVSRESEVKSDSPASRAVENALLHVRR